MVSAMSFSQAVEVYSRYLERHELKDDAETALLQFLNWDAANEETFGQDVRIVLVSAEYSYTVQLKKKAEENRQAKRVEFDFSKYDLMVDGTRLPQLTKSRESGDCQGPSAGTNWRDGPAEQVDFGGC